MTKLSMLKPCGHITNRYLKPERKWPGVWTEVKHKCGVYEDIGSIPRRREGQRERRREGWKER